MQLNQPYQNLMISALNCEAADFHEVKSEHYKLLERFPFITLYIPCYQIEPNTSFLNAICGQPSPFLANFRRSAYLSKDLAECGTPNSSFVTQYVAIEIPTRKTDVQSLLLYGKTFLQPLSIDEVKVKPEVPSLSAQIRNFVRRHLHLR